MQDFTKIIVCVIATFGNSSNALLNEILGMQKKQILHQKYFAILLWK